MLAVEGAVLVQYMTFGKRYVAFFADSRMIPSPPSFVLCHVKVESRASRDSAELCSEIFQGKWAPSEDGIHKGTRMEYERRMSSIEGTYPKASGWALRLPHKQYLCVCWLCYAHHAASPYRK